LATYPPGFLEDLKSRISVSDIVGRKVKLVRRGREFVGLSPFNSEKTPSFTVNDAKGFFHCFSSGEHGDIFAFLIKTEGLSFPEAVQTVAEIAGVDVPKASPEEIKQAERSKGLLEAVAAAAHFFETQLNMPAGKQAAEYLRRRGLKAETIRRFRLGYAPVDRLALLSALRSEGISDELAVEAGLARRGDDGSVYGYFKDRVIFTISDGQGRPIGFGARSLGQEQPKYLNSPDNPLFHKGETLYGLDLAREPAHKSGEMIVVEGYMDVIALAEAGFANTVAPLGTAITEGQIKRLWRIVAAPTLCLDGDAAGQKAARRAALRAVPILEPGRTLKFALLDQGRDPDDLIRQEGAAVLREALNTSVSLIDTVFEDACAEIDVTIPENRAAVDKKLHDLARSVSDETVRHYVRDAFRERLSAAFRVAPVLNQNRVRKAPGSQQKTARILPRPKAPIAAVGQGLREARVLYGCCTRPDVAEGFAERLALLDFYDLEMNRLRAHLVAAFSSKTSIDELGLRASLKDAGLDRALRQMDLAIRRRPSALLGDAVDAAQWLELSISEIEQSDADRSLRARAQVIDSEDDVAAEAISSEKAARYHSFEEK
jgi:DNA primase